MVYDVLGASVLLGRFFLIHGTIPPTMTGTEPLIFIRMTSFQELQELACSEKTHTQENINALKDLS